MGANGTLTIQPNNFSASPGDIVSFFFVTPIKHSVTEGLFDPPCQHNPKPGAIDSKIHVATKGKPFVFNYTVVDTKPRWIYCDVENHCQLGMVAAINPPTTGNETFDAYKAKATNQSVTTSSLSGTTSSGSGPLTTLLPPTTNTTSTTSTTPKPTSTSSKKGAGSRSVESFSIVKAIGVILLGWMFSYDEFKSLMFGFW